MRWLSDSPPSRAHRPARYGAWRSVLVLLVVLATLLGWLPARAAGPALRVADINTTGGGPFIPNNSSSPRGLTTVGSTLFFSADDGSSGRELWKSDGTDANTQRVKNINPGGASSSPGELTDLNGTP